MAFPTIATKSSGTTASGTSHVLTLPTGIVSGDIVVVHFRLNVDATITQPGGWTLGVENEAMLFDKAYGVYWRRADGTEGTTITITTGAAATGGYIIYRISGAHATSNPEFSTLAVAETNTPDPPSKTASWGAEDNLFIASFGGDAVLTTTAYPTSYTLEQTTVAGCAAAARNLAAATDDPGTFTTTGGPAVHGSVTTVVRPAAGGQTFFKALTGTLSFAGVPTRKTKKIIAGAVSPQGLLAKKTSHPLIAALSFAGGLTKRLIFTKSIAGVLSFGGLLSRKTSKILTGGISPQGALVKKTAHKTTGVLTFGGQLLESFQTKQTVAGVLSFAGLLAAIKVVVSGARRSWLAVYAHLVKVR